MTSVWRSTVMCALLSIAAAAPSGCREPTRLAVPAVVPFELRGDLILVTVTVNGSPATLILDSGTGAGLALDSAFAQLSHIDISGHNAKVNGSDRPAPVGSARDVRIGSAALTDVFTVVVDLSVVQSRLGHDVRGTIGYNLFNRYVVAIDYSARRVTLSEPATFHYTGTGTIIPLHIENRLPVLAASVVTRTRGTIPVRLHLDLGSTAYTLRLSKRVVDAQDLTHDTVTVSGPFGVGVGGATQGDLLRMPFLMLGPLTIARPSTALSRETVGPMGESSDTDGTVGESLLRRMHLIIDYSGSRMILEPQGRLDLPDTVDGSGLAVSAADSTGHTWHVVGVVTGGSGANAGIQLGDEVVSIDGTPAATLSYDGIRTSLRADGVTRHLTLRRSNRTWDVALPLKMII